MPVYKSKRASGGGGGSGPTLSAAHSLIATGFLEQGALLRTDTGLRTITFAAGSDLSKVRVGYYAFTRVYRSVSVRGNFVSKIIAVDDTAKTITVEDDFTLTLSQRFQTVPVGTLWHIVPFAGIGAEFQIDAGMTQATVTGYGTLYTGHGGSQSTVSDFPYRGDRFTGGLDGELGYYYTLTNGGSWQNVVTRGGDGDPPNPVGIGLISGGSGRNQVAYELRYNWRDGMLVLEEVDGSRPNASTEYIPMVSNLFLSGS